MSRVVDYYRTVSGKCPVEDFLRTLDRKEREKVYWVLRLLEETERIPVEYFKKLADTEEIWECRIQTGGNAFRIFSFFFRGDTVVLTHGYRKKKPEKRPEGNSESRSVSD